MANIEVTAVDVAPGNVITIQLPGAVGPRGLTGPAGQPNVLTIGTVDTGAAGSNAGATISGVAPNQTLNLTIPQGVQGVKGDPNTLTIGTVNTVAFPTTASATITGIAPNQVLNLVLPRGPGVPAGGAAGSVLAKISATDNDTKWDTPTDAGTANTLVRRDAFGGFGAAYIYGITSVNNPGDAANKGYVDGKTWPSSAISDATNAPTASTAVKRDSAGRAQVADPSVNADIATKNYVDNNAGSVSNTASALVRRDAAGTGFFGKVSIANTPTVSDQATRKDYVDAADTALSGRITTNENTLNAATSAATPSTLISRDSSGGFSAATGTFSGTVTSGGRPLVRHWGQGAAFPTVGLIAGDRFIHTLYGSVSGSMVNAGINSYHAYTEFVWNGYSWRQTHITTVEGIADRQAMTTQIKAAGVSAACQPDYPANALHDGFEVFETAGNRSYRWSGSQWMLIHDFNGGAITGTPTLATGWGTATMTLTLQPNGWGLLFVQATRTGAALTDAGSAGNIANTLMATVPAEWKPPASVPAGGTSTGYMAQGWLGGGGDLNIASVGKGAGIAVGDVVQLSCIYPLADPMLVIGQ